MKGVYLAFFELKESKSVEIGALGSIEFDKGKYVYVGSAMNSLESRVWRHFKGSKENTHWHIDYFSQVANPVGFAPFAVDSKWECIFSEAVRKECTEIDGFGSSDCNCNSHLYRI